MSNILDIVLARLNNLETQIIELQTKDQANFDTLGKVLNQADKQAQDLNSISVELQEIYDQTQDLNEVATNIDICLLDLNNRIGALESKPTMLDTQTHMCWIPFDIQPTPQYSARIAGEHSILGPTRVVCLPPASSRRPR